jgi:hypothetical protein
VNGQDVEVGSPWPAGNVCRVDWVVKRWRSFGPSTQTPPHEAEKDNSAAACCRRASVARTHSTSESAADALLAVALLAGWLWRNTAGRGAMTERKPRTDRPDTAVVHTFTVFRGMSAAIVIETPDWYCGLLQAAAARVRIEGQN